MNTNQNDLKYKDQLEITYKHLWGYFELSATQRVSLFRYYVIFLTAFGASIYHTYHAPSITILLSILFIIISVIFHLIEKRNNNLVGNARKGLRIFEKEMLDKKYRLFSSDKASCSIKHSHCYNSIFYLGYCISIAIIVYCICEINTKCKLHEYLDQAPSTYQVK